MTHIEWQPIKTMPRDGKPRLITDRKVWGMTMGNNRDFFCSDTEAFTIRITHWAEIGELPK